ncbi:MAG: mannitol dehydrogenase family protein [Candidatus Ornithospirochaeta sp.]|nr:mannitol dehydrogenase family protein [Candidatus Ornithospirochaeta sp.]
MKLTDEGLRSPEWIDKGYSMLSYDRDKVRKATAEKPVWIHFGAGNIFRGFPARLQQELIEKGLADRGIIVAEGFDFQIIRDIYRKHDDLSLLVTLKADGSIEKKVIGSVTESLVCDRDEVKDWKRLKDVFSSSSLQMVSFTITEKGYALRRPDGEFIDGYIKDFDAGPGKCAMFLSRLAELLLERYHNGAFPLSLVSMDNCSRNGEKLENAIRTIADQWIGKGLVEAGFGDYLESSVAFPWSMIDKITPRPDPSVAAILKSDGYEDADVLVTEKKTYISSFVNAEECEYLVIEDRFPNGRPPLDKAGVYFTDRETVMKTEKMKVSTCLNPLHTALAVFGCLLGYSLISDEMKDPDLSSLVRRIGYIEGLPVVTDPGIIDPKRFIDQVIEERIPNPFMPDTPQRIATDTSQKLAVRFGETIKAYSERKDLDPGTLRCIPLVFAGWLRYALGVDDEGNAFTPSPDPLLPYVQEALEGISLGYEGSLEQLDPILSNSKIFGVDLVGMGLSDRVRKDLASMISGKGMVRRTLKNALL